MNQKIKRAWVKALRSGKYKQGKNQLRNQYDEFCCFGVLCDLHAQAHPEIAARQEDKTTYMGHSGLPPSAVYVWAGLRSNIRVEIDGKRDHLAALNDDGVPFKKIATAIEEQL